MLLTRFALLILGIVSFSSCDNTYELGCEFNSEGSSLAKGVNATVYYPCDWRPRDNDNPDVVQYITNSNGKVGLSLLIHDIDPGVTFTKESIEENIANYGDVISVKDTIINGRAVIKSVTETTFEDPKLGFAYSKILAFTFPYKNRGISLNFSTQSLEKFVADKDFESYKELFEQISAKVDFR